jgi:ribosomal RNA-processing protein 17
MTLLVSIGGEEEEEEEEEDTFAEEEEEKKKKEPVVKEFKSKTALTTVTVIEDLDLDNE